MSTTSREHDVTRTYRVTLGRPNDLLRLFTATAPLVATIHSQPHPVTDELKQRPDVELLGLSATNREEVLMQLLTRLRR